MKNASFDLSSEDIFRRNWDSYSDAKLIINCRHSGICVCMFHFPNSVA